MKIMAIDPGVMTGFCMATLESQQLRYFPFQMVDDVDELWKRLKDFEPKYAIIEDFEFRRGKRSAGGLNLFPMQLIGVTRLYGELTHCQVFVQKAAQGKSYYTNPVLKQLGLYKPGVKYEHCMDASRHLLQWYTFGFGYQFAGTKTTAEGVTMCDSWEEVIQ